MKYAPILLAAALLAAPHTPTQAQPQNTTDQDRAWFHEARLGLFIHWGIYAVPAGEWQGRQIGGIGEWIMRFAGIPVKDYKAFGADFAAENYDPEAWAELALQSGMKYIVITAKHHDGFSLYNSKVSDWNAVQASAAGRDLIVPLAEAARKRGLKFGIYYSQAQDWVHQGGAIWGGKPSDRWDPAAQAGDYDEYLQKIALPQVEEILELFEPDILWWDTPVNMNRERAKPFAELLARHPHIITNDRLGGNYPGDTRTPERNIPPRGYPGQMFEVCMTMNETWGYKRHDHDWKSVETILQQLSDISSKGGNYLLNIGPMADGTIPPESVERLEALGRWMNVNGAAIYATQASPFNTRLPWGRVTQKTSADGGVTLYAHLWGWTEGGEILLPGLSSKPRSARRLADGQAVGTELDSEGLRVRLAGPAPDPYVSIIELAFDGPLAIAAQALPSPGPNGVIHLPPHLADLHGMHGRNVNLESVHSDPHLGKWNNHQSYVEYTVSTPKAGDWKVEAEVRTPVERIVTVGLAKSRVTTTVPATGTGQEWTRMKLATIPLAQGNATFRIEVPTRGQGGPDIRNVWLIPVE